MLRDGEPNSRMSVFPPLRELKTRRRLSKFLKPRTLIVDTKRSIVNNYIQFSSSWPCDDSSLWSPPQQRGRRRRTEDRSRLLDIAEMVECWSESESMLSCPGIGVSSMSRDPDRGPFGRRAHRRCSSPPSYVWLRSYQTLPWADAVSLHSH